MPLSFPPLHQVVVDGVTRWNATCRTCGQDVCERPQLVKAAVDEARRAHGHEKSCTRAKAGRLMSLNALAPESVDLVQNALPIDLKLAEGRTDRLGAQIVLVVLGDTEPVAVLRDLRFDARELSLELLEPKAPIRGGCRLAASDVDRVRGDSRADEHQADHAERDGEHWPGGELLPQLRQREYAEPSGEREAKNADAPADTVLPPHARIVSAVTSS